MRIKKFTAENTQLALKKVRRELGEEAIVLHVEERQERATGRKFVEVTAALDEEQTREFRTWESPTFRKPEKTSRADFDLEENSPVTYSRPSRTKTLPIENSQPITSSKEVQKDTNSLMESQLVWNMLQGDQPVDLPISLLEMYTRLLANQVNRRLALEILKAIEKRLSETGLSSKKLILEETIKWLDVFLKAYVPSGESESKPHIQVMIGPTGVGKTTCIAKLSAIDCLVHNKSVGLISIDTYRIAAIEQLQTYAKLTHLPLKIVYRPEEMPLALDSLADCDTIYIDTPGRSPHNRQALNEMKAYFQQIQSPEYHLVLSLNSSEEYLKETVDRFSIFPIKRLLFTKLDEITRIGPMLGVLQHSQKPISYLSVGQEVPDDIKRPQSLELATQLVGAH